MSEPTLLTAENIIASSESIRVLSIASAYSEEMDEGGKICMSLDTALALAKGIDQLQSSLDEMFCNESASQPAGVVSFENFRAPVNDPVCFQVSTAGSSISSYDDLGSSYEDSSYENSYSEANSTLPFQEPNNEHFQSVTGDREARYCIVESSEESISSVESAPENEGTVAYVNNCSIIEYEESARKCVKRAFELRKLYKNTKSKSTNQICPDCSDVYHATCTSYASLLRDFKIPFTVKPIFNPTNGFSLSCPLILVLNCLFGKIRHHYSNDSITKRKKVAELCSYIQKHLFNSNYVKYGRINKFIDFLRKKN